MPHIDVRDVSLVYDTPAGRVTGVDGVSFAIEQSEFLCIVGPSGCGKSTLLNMIAGFLTASTGEIRIAASRFPATAWTAASYFRISPSSFPGAPRSATSRSGWR
jgi:ABC-type Fe3+/spermidine/putrescine transport system ATPase subunit